MQALKTSKIDVVVLCGGLGTRLHNVVGDRPKPMADIDGRPFLALLIEYVASFGFRRFVLCTGYKAQVTESFFESGEKPYSVEFSRESELLGTAGALCNANALFQSDPLLVLNGDSFCSLDYAQLIRFHRARSAEITMSVSRMKLSGDYGEVVVGKNDDIESFKGKTVDDRNGWVNAGIYVLNRRVIDSFPQRAPLSLERDIFPVFTARTNMLAFRSNEPLFDIGTPERYQSARNRLMAIMKTDNR